MAGQEMLSSATASGDLLRGVDLQSPQDACCITEGREGGAG